MRYLISKLMLRIPKKIRLSLAFIISAAMLIYMVCSAVRVYPYDPFSIKVKQAFTHNKFYSDYMLCLENGGFDKAEFVYKTEDEDALNALFSVDNKISYNVHFDKKLKNDEVLYKIDDYKIIDRESRYSFGRFYSLDDNIEFIWCCNKADLEDMDFGGYVPKHIIIKAKEDNKADNHYYIFDKSKEPSSDYNVAPIFSLFEEPVDIDRTIELCNLAFSDNISNLTPEDIGRVIGADVKQLPASTPYTYDYALNEDMTIRSYGKPIEKFTVTTKYYDSITIDVKSKQILNH